MQYSLFKYTVGSKALHKHAKVFLFLILICLFQALFPLGLVQNLFRAMTGVLLRRTFLYRNLLAKYKLT